jgi:hypothetical protein
MGQKYGKKGGNPKLRQAVNDTAEESSEIPLKATNKGDLYTPEPQPHPDPENIDTSPLQDGFILQSFSPVEIGNVSLRDKSPDGDRSAVVRIVPRDLFEIYNANRGGMEEASVFTSTRAKHCLARIRCRSDDPITFLSDFTRAIQTAATIQFYLGNNDRGWVGNLDYFIKNDTNYLKVLERRNGHNRSKAEQRTLQNIEAVSSYFDGDTS